MAVRATPTSNIATPAGTISGAYLQPVGGTKLTTPSGQGWRVHRLRTPWLHRFGWRIGSVVVPEPAGRGASGP
jgi:hypothetical protein